MCIRLEQLSTVILINRQACNRLIVVVKVDIFHSSLTNIGEESTSGVDLIFDYDMDTSYGPLTLEGVTTMFLIQPILLRFLVQQLLNVLVTGVVHVEKIHCLKYLVSTKLLLQQSTIWTYHLA